MTETVGKLSAPEVAEAATMTSQQPLEVEEQQQQQEQEQEQELVLQKMEMETQTQPMEPLVRQRKTGRSGKRTGPIYRQLIYGGFLNSYPTRYPTQLQQLEELEEEETGEEQEEQEEQEEEEEEDLEMPCAITAPRISGKQSSSETAQCSEQRSRLSFKQWLVAKNKSIAQQRRRQRREQKQLRYEQLQRQQLAARSFQQWLLAKRRQLNLLRAATARENGRSIGGSAAGTGAGAGTAVQLEGGIVINAEARRRIDEWQRRKVAELETQRVCQQRRQRQRKLRNELRLQLSDLAFQRWLAQSAIKRHMKPATWRGMLQQEERRRQQDKQPQQQLEKPLQQQPQRERKQPQQQRHKQRQLRQRRPPTPSYMLYLHVPLSAAQQSLRDRLGDMDAVKVQRKRRC